MPETKERWAIDLREVGNKKLEVNGENSKRLFDVKVQNIPGNTPPIWIKKHLFLTVI